MTLTQIKPAGLSKPVDLADNEKIRLGTGYDIQIYHDGTNSNIKNTTGTLYVAGDVVTLTNSAISELYFKGTANGAVELYYDNVKKFETTSDGVLVSSGHLKLNDNSYLKLGNAANGDAVLLHNGSDTILDNQTGNLFFRSGSTHLQSLAGEDKIVAEADGAVELYHNNSKKLETTASGVDVTGYLKTSTYLWTDTSLYSDNWISKSNTNGHDMFIYSRDAAGNQAIQAEFKIGQGATFYHNTYRTLMTVDGGIRVYGKEGGSGHVYIQADEGDDNADQWVLRADANASELKIRNTASGSWEDSIICDGNGAVELYYDNAKKFETTANGVKVNNRFEMRNGVIFDNTANGNNCGLSFNGDSVRPTNGSGSDVDNARDLGIASVRWNDLWLGGSANIGNYIRTNYNNNGGGAHMYLKNNSQGANFSSHFQTYASSDESGTTQTHVHYYHGGYCELLHQGNSVVRTLSNGTQFRNGGNVNGQITPNGLCFGSDTAAANALDDYEEGTWTPAFNSFTNVDSSNVRQKIYTKIGNTVHLWLEMFAENDMGWTDNAYIAGTPYSGTSYFPNTLYIPVNVAIMYGPSNYSMDQTAAGRAYYSGYSDKIYFKMGTFANVRHVWLQLTYRTTA